MRRRKLKIKKRPVAILLLVLISPFLINVYISHTPYGKLRTLEYKKSAIKLMSDDLKEELIEKQVYSEMVEEVVLEEAFVANNLDSYLALNYLDQENYISNVNIMLEKNYLVEVIKKAFLNLSEEEINLLVKHEYIENLMEYLNISYFDVSKIDRYLVFEGDYSLEEKVTRVNIGLDYDYYDEEIIKEVDGNDPLVLVNKYNYLSKDFEPKKLVKISDTCSKNESYLAEPAAIAFEKMCQASIAEGYKILSNSAYRSYDTQQATWDEIKAKYGLTYTYSYVAKPGFSEHQTGLALDIASGSVPGAKFAFTKDYTWTINNAYKYGFILRYDEDTSDITGYGAEAWHYRYVGETVAKYIYENDITFDEYIVQN